MFKYKGFDALGDVLKPDLPTMQANQSNITNTAGTSATQQLQLQQQLLQHQQQQQQQQQQHPQLSTSPGKILTGDLDSSLMSLVDNLNINKSSSPKPVQWNSPKNTAKQASNWTPQPMAATTGAGYRPMSYTIHPTHVHVRKSTAIKLCEALLLYGDSCDIPQDNLDDIMNLLSETDWGAPLVEVRPIRNEICHMLGIKPPISNVQNTAAALSNNTLNNSSE